MSKKVDVAFRRYAAKRGFTEKDLQAAKRRYRKLPPKEKAEQLKRMRRMPELPDMAKKMQKMAGMSKRSLRSTRENLRIMIDESLPDSKFNKILNSNRLRQRIREATRKDGVDDSEIGGDPGVSGCASEDV